MAGEWIEWHGGECPVEEGVVDVRFRGGGDCPGFVARNLRWDHTRDGDAQCPGVDIIAYRVVSADAPSASALTTQPGGTHYRECAIQPVQYIEANDLKFLEGCIVKRATRHDKNTGKGREDIEKIIHEAKLILELRYGDAA